MPVPIVTPSWIVYLKSFFAFIEHATLCALGKLTQLADFVPISIAPYTERRHRLQSTFARGAFCIGTFSWPCVVTRGLAAVPDAVTVLIQFLVFIFKLNNPFIFAPYVLAMMARRELAYKATLRVNDVPARFATEILCFVSVILTLTALQVLCIQFFRFTSTFIQM